MSEIKITQYNPDWYPPCFASQQQHKEYMFAVVQTGRPMDPNNYCMDCTRGYKVKMLREKKCEHPETIFVTWRTTYKQPTAEGRVVSTTETDMIGISDISKFWNSPLYD